MIGFNPQVELSVGGIGFNGTISLGKYHLKILEEWNILKIVVEVPYILKNSLIKLFLDFSDLEEGIVLVNKISGCHPFAKEDRVNLGNSTKFKGLISSFQDALEEVLEVGNCTNGGISVGGRCDCPAGFYGETCDKGCGPNRFGPSCEAECSQTAKWCREMIFCKRATGCYCAPGYKGKYCSETCSSGEYGVSCKEECGMCLGESCDAFTGRCLSGCMAGYVPPMCQTKYVYLVKRPILRPDFNSASLKAEINNSVAGIGQPTYYQIQIRSHTSDSWKLFAPEDIPNDKIIIYNITQLAAGTTYYSRVILLDFEGQKYEGSDIPITSFKTKCNHNGGIEIVNTAATYDSLRLSWKNTYTLQSCPTNESIVNILIDNQWMTYNVEGYNFKMSNLVPDSTYLIKIKLANASDFTFVTVNTTSYISGLVRDINIKYVGHNEVQLEWKPLYNSKSPSFKVSYSCLRIIAEETLSCANDRGTIITPDTSARLTGLKPFRRYSTQIQETGGKGHSDIEFSTLQALPTAKVRSLTIVPRKSSASASWQAPHNCSNCNGFLRGYQVSLKDPNGTVQSHFTKNTCEQFQNLKPQYVYRLSVYVQNNVGWNGDYPTSVDLRSASGIPSRVRRLELYKRGKSLLGLRWESPEFPYGTVAYVVSIDGKRFVHKPEVCPSWPQQFCFTVGGLKANTVYNVSVSARNREEDGESSFIEGVTAERAPGEPVDITQTDATETSVALRWRPPNLMNGVLRYFLVKIEQTESFDTDLCCEYYPKSEVPVNSEQEYYWTEIYGLNPGSTFAVSVMGETVWLGPAAGIDAVTRPPKPCPVLLPLVRPALAWQDVEEDCPSKRESVSALVQGHLLVRVKNEGGNQVTNPDLRLVLERALGSDFDMVAEYSAGAGVQLGTGTSNGSWGILKNPHLETGHNYTFAAVTVVRYKHLFNVAVRKANSLSSN
ncbi:hypothetical protein AAG570_010728 [Ranatra chinensis]|uniref:Fibronectin type-III domain-containing protein n=1 Tax=Ranatra chinensis TaxID=642074 RepID=A0ABD0YNF3_9HEMI